MNRIVGSDLFVSELVVEKSYILAGFKAHWHRISQDALVLSDNAGESRRLYGTADNFLYFPASTMNAFDVAGSSNFVYNA